MKDNHVEITSFILVLSHIFVRENSKENGYKCGTKSSSSW